MAKLNLKGTDRDESTFGKFASGYRQSNYIEDRRANQFRPTETPDDANAFGDLPRGWNGSTNAKTMQTKDPIDELFGTSKQTYDTTPKNKPGQSRKADPEEAIRTTSNRR